jgi:hypothetical protein
MSEVNNISVESIGTPKSTERDLPIDSYIERLNSKLEEFSSTMYVDTEALTNEPKGRESWDEIEHYLKCIRISEEQPESIVLPYWGSVRLPTSKELAEPDTEEYTPEEVLGRLFVVNAALNVEFDYYNKETFKEEVMTLGQLISEVYPGLQGGVKEIRKELEFAFRNPEGFKKKFSEKERLVGGLTRRAFIKKGVETVAASLFVLTSMTLASCSGKQVQTEPTPIVETYTPVVPIETEEATLTPTETQEPTPTPTETQEPTPTPTETRELSPTPTKTATRIPFTENHRISGYRIGNWLRDSETGVIYSTITVTNIMINNIRIDNNEIIFDISLNLYNRQFNEEVKAKSFTYLEINTKTAETLKQIEITPQNVKEILSVEEKYRGTFTVVDNPNFAFDLIENYVDGEINLEFELYNISKNMAE